jgi:uncharacterized protein with HEPN domain
LVTPNPRRSPAIAVRARICAIAGGNVRRTAVSAEGRAAAPDVPWVEVTGMRNRLVHADYQRRAGQS